MNLARKLLMLDGGKSVGLSITRMPCGGGAGVGLLAATGCASARWPNAPGPGLTRIWFRKDGFDDGLKLAVIFFKLSKSSGDTRTTPPMR